MHFVPTNISLSYNVEITVHTTNVTPDTSSHERLKRELQLISVEWDFQQSCPHLWRLLSAYFPLSQLLLMQVIISKMIFVSSPNRLPDYKVKAAL